MQCKQIGKSAARRAGSRWRVGGGETTIYAGFGERNSPARSLAPPNQGTMVIDSSIVALSLFTRINSNAQNNSKNEILSSLCIDASSWGDKNSVGDHSSYSLHSERNDKQFLGGMAERAGFTPPERTHIHQSRQRPRFVAARAAVPAGPPARYSVRGLVSPGTFEGEGTGKIPVGSPVQLRERS